MNSHRARRSWAWTLSLLILGGTVLATPFLYRAFAHGKSRKSSLVTDSVKRRPLRIAVSNTGFLDSQQSVTLLSQVEYRTTILSIAAEGTRVKRGDVVCELDSAVLQEELIERQMQLVDAEALLAQAKQDVEIQKILNDSSLAAAELQLRLTDLDLQKYKHGDYPTELNQLQSDIRFSQEALRRTEDLVAFRKRLAMKGYYSIAALEADQSALAKAEVTVKVAQDKQRVLQDYSYERQISELEAKHVEAAREIERARRKAEAALVQAQVKMNNYLRVAQTRRNQVERVQRNIAACVVRAPQDGEVVYANQNRRSSSSTPIDVGTEVQYRQELVKLPNLAKMKVDARIHESRINLVRPGLTAKIRVDALPDQEFHGSVKYVSSVPLSGNWPNYDLKEYEAVISVDDYSTSGKRLKPGLTAHVEIEVDDRDAVLQVPVQAVVEMAQQHYTCVLTDEGPQLRNVHIGQTNDVAIEILDGLAEGENVVLNLSSEFATELEELAEHPVELPAAQTTALERDGVGG